MKILLVCMILLIGAEAQDLKTRELRVREEPRVLCGRRLAVTRMMICFSSNEEPQKRALGYPLIGPSHHEDLAWPWLAHRAQALTMGRGKRGPGLVDECCYKPCYDSELLNYC